MNKLVSIIIPAWQSAGTLPGTLRTVLAQACEPLEVILIDDASTDETEKVIAPFRDRIKYLKLEKNSGAQVARNTGFRLSKGEYVMFCDSDLIFKPDAIQKLVTALEENPQASYAYSSFKLGWKKFTSGEFDVKKLKERNFVHTSALIRREAEPRFDESLKRFHDWDLWLTLLEQGKVGVWVPEILYKVIPRGKIGISTWRPSIWHRIPWDKLGWKPKTIRAYQAAAEIIKRKHGI
ncbi:MAG: glycosyltransferase family 2 protein [bacterium]